MGFTWARPVTSKAVVSYTAFPPLPAQNAQAVYFCCTGLGVTSTGRYPASCPMKPGLSYSRFMYGLKLAGVEMNRKILADMAINDAEGFKTLAELAKSKLA